MQCHNVAYSDFDRTTGERPNGEKLPLNGDVRTQAAGYRKEDHFIQFLNPQEHGTVTGFTIIFDNQEEKAAVIKKLKSAIK